LLQLCLADTRIIFILIAIDIGLFNGSSHHTRHSTFQRSVVFFSLNLDLIVHVDFSLRTLPNQTQKETRMTTTTTTATATGSTPQFHRLEQLESPNSRYAGRRVSHIETSALKPAPSPELFSPKAPKHSRSLAFAVSPPLVKRSRSAEQSEDDARGVDDDDEFLLAVAHENSDSRRRLDDDDDDDNTVRKQKSLFFLKFF
jgi:hypothetical protein